MVGNAEQNADGVRRGGVFRNPPTKDTRESGLRGLVLGRILVGGVGLYFLLLPFQWALQPVAGVDLPVGRILAMAIVLGWLGMRLVWRQVWVPRHIASAALISFCFVAAASVLWSEERAWAFRKTLFLLMYAPLFFVVADLVRDVFARRRVLRAIVWGAGLAAGVGIIQFCLQFVFGVGEMFHFWLERILPLFLGAEFGSAVAAYPSLLVNLGGETVLRASAFFPDPHIMAYYMGLCLPLGFFLAVSGSSRSKRRCFATLSVLILCADVLTFSRGGYVALAVAGLVTIGMWLWNKERSKDLWKVALIGLLGTTLFFLSPAGQRFASVLSPSDGSNQERLRLWTEAGKHILSRPLTGYGLGNYVLAVKPSAGYREPFYAHNLYLDVAAETGLVGVFFFLLFFLGVVASSIRGWIRNRKPLSLAVLGALVVYGTHSLFETPLFSVHILPLLLALAGLGSVETKQSSDV